MDKTRLEDIFVNLAISNMARGIPKEEAIKEAKSSVEEIIKASKEIESLIN